MNKILLTLGLVFFLSNVAVAGGKTVPKTGKELANLVAASPYCKVVNVEGKNGSHSYVSIKSKGKYKRLRRSSFSNDRKRTKKAGGIYYRASYECYGNAVPKKKKKNASSTKACKKVFNKSRRKRVTVCRSSSRGGGFKAVTRPRNKKADKAASAKYRRSVVKRAMCNSLRAHERNTKYLGTTGRNAAGTQFVWVMIGNKMLKMFTSPTTQDHFISMMKKASYQNTPYVKAALIANFKKYKKSKGC